MANVETLKKAAGFGIAITKQVILASEGGWKVTDLLGFLPVLTEIPEIVKEGPDLLAELKALDSDGAAELNTYVATNFDIPNDKVEGVIEKAFSILTNVIALVNDLRPAEVVEPVA